MNTKRGSRLAKSPINRALFLAQGVCTVTFSRVSVSDPAAARAAISSCSRRFSAICCCWISADATICSRNIRSVSITETDRLGTNDTAVLEDFLAIEFSFERFQWFKMEISELSENGVKVFIASEIFSIAQICAGPIIFPMVDQSGYRVSEVEIWSQLRDRTQPIVMQLEAENLSTKLVSSNSNVALALLNLLGEDDDDFECNWLIDRNMSTGIEIVDTCHDSCPPLKLEEPDDEKGTMYWCQFCCRPRTAVLSEVKNHNLVFQNKDEAPYQHIIQWRSKISWFITKVTQGNFST
ncbi:hypothetical protein GCK72_012659 [Caenorhabditis remanei]|uniref:Bestrophin homolog n=1 Tax=Caenorhabditis remanei TaxID=31234 RepID=A0A6A5GNU6_CAERE|nr:hypothetical protein GCK72_012659 [Caenorhabditis remanei]KAF1756206.1 hypothetical protein GCK72_012659 [Caenorhabditis remanei]